jgi:hypothetical protein
MQAAPAEVVCPVCGATNQGAGNFCDNCGAGLAAASAGQLPAQAPPDVVQGQPRLIVAQSQVHLSLVPGKAEWLVGREDPVSGVFPDVDLTPHGADSAGVSRRHCVIRQQGGQYTIEDLRSTNGTFVNKSKLVPESPQILNNGDEVRLGRVVLNFHVM